MPDFNDHTKVLTMLEAAQEADGDNRDRAREASLFVNKRDGQWEPYWSNIDDEDRPRMTFDMTSPILDQLAGEMELAEFEISVAPSGSGANKEAAKLFDGIIRNIQDVSSAADIYNMASRNMLTGGMDGWIIKQKFIDDDSFDQDLVIESIANYLDSVWFGMFKMPDGSDMPWCIVLEGLEKEVYEEKYPKGSGKSIGENRITSAYFNKPEQVIIGNIYYIVKRPQTLLRMSTGQVYREEDVSSILDELADAGITVSDTRTREKSVVMSRLLDGGMWLNTAQETVFNKIPVIPLVANFNIIENKMIYYGFVEKQIDPQRAFNHTKSREIEEGALAPRAKYWMTETQTAGHEQELATLNTNSDPAQLYNNDPEVPGPPQQIGGATINPGLRALSDDMKNIMQQISGQFSASMGDNPGLQSGVAIEKLQYKGSVGTSKYFASRERAICLTGRILVDAIPKLITGPREMRILKQDGSFDMTTINQPVFDEETRSMVTANDLSGNFTVNCTAGPAFQTQQQATVSAITEIGQVDPSAVEMGGDILYGNMTTPGMDLLAERKRQQLFLAGVIPVEQMTDEEKQIAQQQQQQPKEPDPATLLAQAEIGKAQAQANKVQVDAQAAQRREDREDFKTQQSVVQNQQQMVQQQQTFDFDRFMAIQQQQMKQQQQLIDTVTAQADILKTIREAMGADSIIGPSNMAAYVEQSGNVLDAVSGSEPNNPTS